MPTFLRNKTLFKLTPLRKENLFTQSNVAFHRRLKISLSFKYTTTLLSDKARDGGTGTGSMCEKMVFKIIAKNRGTQGKVETEPRLYALTNTLAEIKAEIILRESRSCADQGTYQHYEPKFPREEG